MDLWMGIVLWSMIHTANFLHIVTVCAPFWVLQWVPTQCKDMIILFEKKPSLVMEISLWNYWTGRLNLRVTSWEQFNSLEIKFYKYILYFNFILIRNNVFGNGLLKLVQILPSKLGRMHAKVTFVKLLMFLNNFSLGSFSMHPLKFHAGLKSTCLSTGRILERVLWSFWLQL